MRLIPRRKRVVIFLLLGCGRVPARWTGDLLRLHFGNGGPRGRIVDAGVADVGHPAGDAENRIGADVGVKRRVSFLRCSFRREIWDQEDRKYRRVLVIRPPSQISGRARLRGIADLYLIAEKSASIVINLPSGKNTTMFVAACGSKS